jgi:hypothetical protein
VKSRQVDKRYPLRRRPGRSAGQSAAEIRNRLIEDAVLWPMMVSAALSVLALAEWLEYFMPRPPQPWLFTAVALISVAYAVIRIVRAIPLAKALKLGAEGERSVAFQLDALRAKGYQVFHDFLGAGFNIDHVLIGPAGVFTIETKTRTKPEREKATVSYDGRSVRIAGWEPSRNPVIQARAQAAWLREMLRQHAETDVWVRSVVVFPGWWIDESANQTSDTWVLNPDRLPAYLERQPNVLSKEAQHLLATHVRRIAEEQAD